MTHICVIKLGPHLSIQWLVAVRHHATLWINVGLLLRNNLQWNSNQSRTITRNNIYKRIIPKMSSEKYRPFCLDWVNSFRSSEAKGACHHWFINGLQWTLTYLAPINDDLLLTDVELYAVKTRWHSFCCCCYSCFLQKECSWDYTLRSGHDYGPGKMSLSKKMSWWRHAMETISALLALC